MSKSYLSFINERSYKMSIKLINNASTCCYLENNRSNIIGMESISLVIKILAKQFCEEKKSAKYEKIVDKKAQKHEINER